MTQDEMIKWFKSAPKSSRHERMLWAARKIAHLTEVTEGRAYQILLVALIDAEGRSMTAHTAKRFIGLAIGVRTRSRDLHLLASRSYENDCGFSICLFPFPEIGSGAYPMAPAGGRMAVGVYVFLQYGNRIPRLGPSLSDALSGNGVCVCA